MLVYVYQLDECLECWASLLQAHGLTRKEWHQLQGGVYQVLNFLSFVQKTLLVRIRADFHDSVFPIWPEGKLPVQVQLALGKEKAQSCAFVS